MAEYWEVKCLWNLLSPSQKDRNLRQMSLTKRGKGFDMSGKLFWKQPLRWVAENSVFKILAKPLKVSGKEFFSIAFIQNQKSYKKPHLCLHYIFLIFLNTAKQSDKSYMINHVVYFGLNLIVFGARYEIVLRPYQVNFFLAFG